MQAIFAAGCFWGIELIFSQLSGVTSTTVGYTGGNSVNPSYEEVCDGNTGHAEAVLVEFNLKIISYSKLLDIFWESHDPTTLNRQGPDIGTQYRSSIFYNSNEQKNAALDSKETLRKSGKYQNPIVTEIVEFTIFYPAEEYHQKYLHKQRGIPY